MKNQEKVERDKEAVDYQLGQKINEGVFSRPFHTSRRDRKDITCAMPGLPDRLQMFAEEFCGSLLDLLL